MRVILKNVVWGLLVFSVWSFINSGELKAAESVTFKIVVVNPSKTKTQTTPVKKYLPIEIKPDDIINSAGLDLEYDTDRSIFYLYKETVELSPSEVKVFEIEVRDVWLVADAKLLDFRERTDSILANLEDTEYYLKAEEIANSIFQRLSEIGTTQADESVSRQSHIGIYRQNLLAIENIDEDIAKMEKILVTAGGPPSPSMLADANIKADSPSKTMTWIVIFVIIIFSGLLAGVLFFTWQHQARLTKDSLSGAKKSAFPEADSKENKSKAE
ncbi:MAG: hypothetical protein KJ957_01525 [Candidatus Omnitrophica bacterium]|nr:hypothetical protein [Candidatus Omnitrophota bacterium]MBU1852709.1 hypothetical protein [Candidatus Omnitrophota bacterium]